ncbi:MAG: glycoside hydrolase family 28 protein [Candidatus Spyradocola sp.]|jgi:hypothetical protein
MQFFSIVDYGAQPGKKSTQAIQRALDAASEAGGVAVIPRGTFFTGTLNLRAASLCLEKGAVLKGSPDFADYPEIGYDHNEMGQVRSLLYTMDEQDVHIYGEGTIDLTAEAFYDMDKRTIPPSAAPLTPAQIAECTATYVHRPNQPLFFLRCRHVRVEDVRITGAPCWTMAFIECEDVRVRNLTIDNDRRIPNNDGMHFCSCKGVIVRGCNISSGDDCIALSGITNWDRPCEDVVISDCILRSSSKAIVVGYMHSIVRNVNISNCQILDSNRGLCLMSSTAGLVENVTAANLRLDTRCRAGNWWGNGEAVCVMGTFHNLSNYRDPIPQREAHACIRNVVLQNLCCTTENALAVVGEQGSVENVHLDHLTVQLKDSENLCVKGRVIDISPAPNTARLPEEPTWLYLRGVRDVTVTNAFVAPFHGKMPIAYAEDVENVRF